MQIQLKLWTVHIKEDGRLMLEDNDGKTQSPILIMSYGITVFPKIVYDFPELVPKYVKDFLTWNIHLFPNFEKKVI